MTVFSEVPTLENRTLVTRGERYVGHTINKFKFGLHEIALFVNSLISLLDQRVLPVLSFTGCGSRPSLAHNHIVDREVSKYLAKVLSDE